MLSIPVVLHAVNIYIYIYTWNMQWTKSRTYVMIVYRIAPMHSTVYTKTTIYSLTIVCFFSLGIDQMIPLRSTIRIVTRRYLWVFTTNKSTRRWTQYDDPPQCITIDWYTNYRLIIEMVVLVIYPTTARLTLDGPRCPGTCLWVPQVGRTVCLLELDDADQDVLVCWSMMGSRNSTWGQKSCYRSIGYFRCLRFLCSGWSVHGSGWFDYLWVPIAASTQYRITYMSKLDYMYIYICFLFHTQTLDYSVRLLEETRFKTH